MSRYEANADALRKMVRGDDDLTTSRRVYFSILFPNRNLAESFVKEVFLQGFETELKKCGEDSD